MAMLEAFVYDPLISWRLLADGNNGDVSNVSRVNSNDDEGLQHKSPVEKLREQVITSEFLASDHTEISPKRVTMSEVKISKELSGAVRSPDDEPLQNNLNTR
jgi:phosphatidylinositol kinase/protein kinase (PI-3  family)